MKYLNKILILFVVIFALYSCDTNENFEILPAPESFAIVTPTNGTVIVLDDTNLDNNALFLSWKSTMNTTESTYTIEVAETGTDFAAPITLATVQGLNFSMTVDELNTFLLDELGINPNNASSVDFRISGNGETSDSIAVVFTPYQVEYTELYLVGSLTGWDPATSLPMTNVGYNVFEITIDLADDDAFKFLPTNSGWDNDLGEDPDNPGFIIKEGEQDISGYPAGKYKITVDLNTLTFTVEEVISPDNLYLVGSINGWDNSTAQAFYKSGENLFTLAVELPDGAEFKFLPTLGSWDGDWGDDPNNAGGLIQEGEQNVSGYAAGKYLITVDFNTLTYWLTPVDNLYIVGSINGWDNTSAFEMGEASVGVFSLVLDLPDGAEFKFLPTLGSWDGDWGDDPNSAGKIIQEGENNLSGYAAGQYVVSVNFNTLSYTVSSISEIPSSLYLVGSFGGWSNDAANPQFTEISSGVFEITQVLDADDEFKFVPVAGSWDNDWGESKSSTFVLEQNDEQNMKVTDAGTYVITVDFTTGVINLAIN